MSPHLFRRLICSTCLLIVLANAAPVESSERLVVEGTVYDADSKEPIPHVTVQTVGADRSTLANDEGRYRFILRAEDSTLRFSHIAYFSQEVKLSVTDSVIVHDIYLNTCMVDIGEFKVYSREYDPGQRIIVEAIRRKQDILSKIHDYRYDAYVKLVINDETKEDSSWIMLITETQTTGYWEQPDKYKEVITSRKQSANIEAENNLVVVGEILNFNENRIELGRYAVVSPTAEDALDHYNYYLVDTVFIDLLPVFRLEIEPKNPDDALFEGFIHIADSTFDVVMVDVGFSRGADLQILKNPRYSQRFAKFDNQYWMPIEIRFSAGVEFDVPLPTIPRKLSYIYTASLYSYQFERGHPKSTFGEYALEVAESADDIDSTLWLTSQTTPLTQTERDAYRQIDSIENKPKSVGKMALMGLGAAAYLWVVGEEDIFRFNRVEGSYLGFGMDTRRLHGDLALRLKIGYAIEAKRAQHQFGMTYRLHRGRKVRVGFDVINRITHRPTVISDDDFNPTFEALMALKDPYDYFRIRGYRVFASTKLFDRTRLRIGFDDFEHYSEPLRTDYSFFGDPDQSLRENPDVIGGRLRSISARFRYDSRPLLNSKGVDYRIGELQYARIEAGVEYASPDFIDNDFDFRRYYVDLRRRQRTLGLGISEFRVYAGGSDGALPPQRYFSVDFSDSYFSNRLGFNTFDGVNFGGNRTLVISAHHNFRRRLFVASGIPGVKDIPLWLSVYGGVFWTEFRNHTPHEGDDYIVTANRSYRELGFGLGNLTPFLTPFNLGLNFTWQLSNYETSDFSIYLGLEL
jgi:hypothetical protein